MRVFVLALAAVLAISVSQAVPASAQFAGQSSPTYEQALEQSVELIEDVREEEPTDFKLKVGLMTASPATVDFLDSMSFRDMTADRQAELFAATADLK